MPDLRVVERCGNLEVLTEILHPVLILCISTNALHRQLPFKTCDRLNFWMACTDVFLIFPAFIFDTDFIKCLLHIH